MYKLTHFYRLYIIIIQLKASRGAGAQSVPVKGCKDWLWVRSSHEEVNFSFTFMFSLLRCGIEAKRGVEFRHSTLNASGIWWKETTKSGTQLVRSA